MRRRECKQVIIHREFVGGFHKRKVERRKVAEKEQKQALQKAKRENRKELREDRKQKLEEYDRIVNEQRAIDAMHDESEEEEPVKPVNSQITKIN